MAGFVFARQKGDHRIYTRDNCVRPIVIPTYKEVDQNVIQPRLFPMLKTAVMEL